MILVALAAIFVASVAMWISTARSRRAAQADISTLAKESIAFAASERTARERIAVAEKKQHDATAATAALSAAKSAGKETAAPRLRTQSELIANSPALELLELQRQRAAVNQDYRRFFQRTGVTAGDAAKFCDLKVRYAENWMDVQAAARAQGEAGREMIARLQAQLKTAHEAALADLLGPECFRQLQKFEQSIPIYNVIVHGLAGVAALEGMPLMPEQGQRLLAAAVDASRGTTPRGDIDLAALDWAALEAHARQILTPEQFAIFKNVEAPSGFQGHWKHELDAAVRRALAQDSGGTPTNPKRLERP